MSLLKATTVRSVRSVYAVAHRALATESNEKLPSAATRDHYALLEVRVDATPTEIREAFYRKVKLLHPDVNPSPEAKDELLRVQTAFKVLKDASARADYNSKHSFERNLDKRAEDLEVYMMARKQARSHAHGRSFWSERLFVDMTRASALRAVMRGEKKDDSLKARLKRAPIHKVGEELAKPEKMPRFLDLGETPDMPTLKKKLYRIIGMTGVSLIACFTVSEMLYTP